MNYGAIVWSVRRELWENRSIYLAPLIVAMLGSRISGGMDATPQREAR